MYQKIDEFMNPGITIDELEDDLENARKKHNPEYKRWNAHYVLAEHMLKQSMLKPENADVLAMVANTYEDMRKRVILQVADYIMRVDPLPSDPNKLEKAVYKRMDDKDLLDPIAHRVRDYYQKKAFSKEAVKGDPVLKAEPKKNPVPGHNIG